MAHPKLPDLDEENNNSNDSGDYSNDYVGDIAWAKTSVVDNRVLGRSFLQHEGHSNVGIEVGSLGMSVNVQ